MENTSRGFHTATICKPITVKEFKRIFMDFEDYKEKTGKIKIFEIGKKKAPDGADEFTKWLYESFQQYYVIHYPNQHKGILWLLRYSNCSPGFIKPGEIDRPCSVKATINPKILIGEKDYLAAATADYLDDVEALFNTEARKISPILGEYKSYSMSRPDYCINFDLDELEIPCTAERMIYLIKHGDIPHHYSERTKYIKTSKRNRPDKDSFYLESKSVTINCYRKHKQLSDKFSGCPNIEESHNLIRFEVQCNYLKTYALTKNIKNRPGVSNSDVIREMLSEDFCADIIRDYFYRVIRRGDYFTLDGAIKVVQSHGFRRKKEARLISELRRINQFRSIHKVRATLQADEQEAFRRTLSDLAAINVNPVTIPKDWKIARIPNLLDAYNRSIEEEQYSKWQGERDNEILEDYFKDCNKKKSKQKKH